MGNNKTLNPTKPKRCTFMKARSTQAEQTIGSEGEGGSNKPDIVQEMVVTVLEPSQHTNVNKNMVIAQQEEPQ